MPLLHRIARRLPQSLCLIYSILAFVSIPFILRLKCKPNDIESITETITCKGVVALVFAIAVSSGVSEVSSLVFLFKDIRSKEERSTLKRCLPLLLYQDLSLALLHAHQTSHDDDVTYHDKLSNMILLGVVCGFSLVTILGGTICKILLLIFFTPEDLIQ